MREPAGAFVFRGEGVPPGERRRFELPAGRLASGTWLTVPVEVIHGAWPGPAIWLSGAIHGDEIVGVEIIRQVVDSLDPTTMAGTLVAVPVVNVFGFVTESRYLPDRRDLNRSFPGSRQGSLAARLARLFVDEIVDPCSFGLDFHAGSDDRINLPHIRGNLDDPETRHLALSFGAALVVHNKPPSGTLRAAALRRGKRVLLFEGGEPRRFSPEAVEAGIAGTLRVVSALGMTEESPPPSSHATRTSRSTTWTRAPRGGIFRLETHLGASLEKGDRIGTITDPAAHEGTPVRARTGGLVVGHTVNPLVNPGDGILHVARLEEG
ncbi:MAG: succinylglutamate desuccinylase/aspartoacylase family protein [Gemmatimonadota bacterium]